MADQLGFLELDARYAALSKAGRPLERLSAVVDKSHVTTDRRHGFIRRWSVTDAARHDGHSRW